MIHPVRRPSVKNIKPYPHRGVRFRDLTGVYPISGTALSLIKGGYKDLRCGEP